MNGIRIGVPMKTSLLFVAVFSSASAWAVDAIPTAYGRERYEETLVQNPFVLAPIEEKSAVTQRPEGVVCGYTMLALEARRKLETDHSRKNMGNGTGKRDQKVIRDPN